jgi:hypothetical protein
MLQAGRSPVRVPDEVDFLIYEILPAALWPLGSTRPLREMSTRNLPGGKSVRHVGLTTLPISETVGASTSHNPKGLHGMYSDNFTFY